MSAGALNAVAADFGGMKEIQLAPSHTAKIDDADFDLVRQYVWTLYQKGQTAYAICYLDPSDSSRRLRMHRLIMDPQPSEVVDHIDGDGLNNQRSNLRICSQAENTRNRRKSGGWTSAYKGVSKAKGRRKEWKAQIRSGEKVRCLGYFETEEEAARAYDAAAAAVFGQYARLNFPAAYLTPLDSGLDSSIIVCP